MNKSKIYKVIVYYEDRTKDVREWIDSFDLALSDYMHHTCYHNVRRCELVEERRFSKELIAFFDRGAV